MSKFQTKCFLNQKPLYLPGEAGAEWSTINVEFPASAPVANDLIELAEIPSGFKVLDYSIVFPDVDSNGAPAFAFSLGIENAGATDLGAEVWAAGLTAGQSNAIVRATTSVAAQGDSSVDRKLAIKVTTAAATYAGATKVGQVMLLLQG